MKMEETLPLIEIMKGFIRDVSLFVLLLLLWLFAFIDPNEDLVGVPGLQRAIYTMCVLGVLYLISRIGLVFQLMKEIKGT